MFPDLKWRGLRKQVPRVTCRCVSSGPPVESLFLIHGPLLLLHSSPRLPLGLPRSDNRLFLQSKRTSPRFLRDSSLTSRVTWYWRAGPDDPGTPGHAQTPGRVSGAPLGCHPVHCPTIRDQTEVVGVNVALPPTVVPPRPLGPQDVPVPLRPPQSSAHSQYPLGPTPSVTERDQGTAAGEVLRRGEGVPTETPRRKTRIRGVRGAGVGGGVWGQSTRVMGGVRESPSRTSSRSPPFDREGRGWGCGGEGQGGRRGLCLQGHLWLE